MGAETAIDGGRKGGLLTVALCCGSIIFEGFGLQVPGVTAPALAPLFGMSPAERGLFLSISTFGLMLGAVMGGYLSDRFGRKRVLVVSICLFGLLSIATALATSTQMLLWARFIGGVGMGGALPNLLAISVESVSESRRNTAMGFLLGCPPIGGALVSIIAAVASRPDQWPIDYYVGGVLPLVVIVPLLIFLLPDTRKAVTAGVAQPKAASFLFALFGQRRTARTLAIWLGFFSILLVLFLLLGWLPSLMVTRGVSRSGASVVQLAFNLCSIPASMVAGVLIDKAKGSTPAVLFVFVLVCLALTALALGPSTLLASIILAGVAGATVTSGQTLIFALAPACYPAAVRGKGVGVCVAVGRIGSAGGPLIAGFLVAAGMQPSQVILSLVPVSIVSAAAAVFLSRVLKVEAPAQVAGA